MDWNELKKYIGVKTNDNDAFIKRCYDDAVILIDMQLANAFRECPESIREHMILEVGMSLYNRKNAPGPQSQMTQFDGTAVPVRAPRDHLYSVRPILGQFVVPF